MLLLTGANGFVGQAVMSAANKHGLKIRPVYRTMHSVNGHGDAALVPEIDGSTDWSAALNGIDILIHTAARAHVMKKESLEQLLEYRRVNVEGTLNLARQAAAAGIRRFIFISSIKVNGEATTSGRPFTADDIPCPQDAYGQSKAEAEVQLKELADLTGMEVTIIRPPLIYGPGVKGNLASLISWVRRELPLPLGDLTHNLRSLVGLDNLVDLILTCSYHPKAANQTFLISDGEDLSTTELIRRIAKALGQQAHLLSVSPWLISLMAGLLGKKVISERLLGSLQVDMHKTCQLLDWKPSVSVDEGLCMTVK